MFLLILESRRERERKIGILMIRENHRSAGLNQFLLMLVNRVIIQAFDQECLLNTQKKTCPCFSCSSKS